MAGVMMDATALPVHGSQLEALLYLLLNHPDGVTRGQLASYWYLDKRGKPTCLGWSARNRISDLRKNLRPKGKDIKHIALHGTSAWKLVTTSEENGQLVLGFNHTT